MSNASNIAELSAREAARQLLGLSPRNQQNLERWVGGSSWRPKLVTSVLGELVKQPSCRTLATADTAWRLLQALGKLQVELNIFHYNGAINVCQKCSAWELAMAFLEKMPRRSIQPDGISYNAVMGACGEASWQLVLHLLGDVPLNVISFNTAAKTFDRSGHWQLALRTLDLLRAANFQPDMVSYGSVMNSLAGGGRWCEISNILQLMFTERLVPDLLCYTSFIKACSKEKQWLLAMQMLVSMAEAQVVPDLISCSSAIASCSAQWRISLALFDIAMTAMAPDVPISNALLMSFSSHWKMAMCFLRNLAGLRIRGDEITQNLASDSYIKGTQWPSALGLFDLDHHLPARVLPLDQWQAALRTLGSFITPERVSQAAEHASAQKWQLGLAIFEQMDLAMVQRDERNWNDAVAACQNDAWPLALHALPVLLAARLSPSSTYQAAILGGHNLEMFTKCRDSMTPAAACGTMARLSVNDPRVIHSSMVAASCALDDSWSPQDLSLLWWSCAMLGVSNPLLFHKLKEICLISLRLMSSEGLLALAIGASASVNDVIGNDGLAVLGAVQDEISSRLKLEVHLSHADILGVVSACKLVGNVQGRLEERVKKFLYQVGAKMDQVAVGGIKLKPRRASMLMDFRTFAGNASVPAVVLNLLDRAVLYKPPGWEVHDEHLPKQLRTFALEAFPNKAILQDVAHNCGFLHRLDVPNSGLLLLATSYRAYYELQLQLAAGSLQRDYLVLVHGVASLRDLGARVQRRGERSVAGGRGRPSHSKVVEIAKMQSAFTLMYLRIVTGRQHQIRCHLAHVGHPVVCDGLYSSSGTFQSDCGWCPRNWLHRWRLIFHHETRKHQVSMALPADLAKTLEPKVREAAGRWAKNGAMQSVMVGRKGR